MLNLSDRRFANDLRFDWFQRSNGHVSRPFAVKRINHRHCFDHKKISAFRCRQKTWLNLNKTFFKPADNDISSSANFGRNDEVGRTFLDFDTSLRHKKPMSDCRKCPTLLAGTVGRKAKRSVESEFLRIFTSNYMWRRCLILRLIWYIFVLISWNHIGSSSMKYSTLHTFPALMTSNSSTEQTKRMVAWVT